MSSKFMNSKLNSAIDVISKLAPNHFINNVKFKEPLNAEILKDSTLWANLLMDSFPSSIAEKHDIFRIIQENILGKLIFELLDSDEK